MSLSAASITDVPADAGFLRKSSYGAQVHDKMDKLQNSYTLKILPHCIHIQIPRKPVRTKIIRSAYLKTYVHAPDYTNKAVIPLYVRGKTVIKSNTIIFMHLRIKNQRDALSF